MSICESNIPKMVTRMTESPGEAQGLLSAGTNPEKD